jgi:PAS domain S-box-containing protein
MSPRTGLPLLLFALLAAAGLAHGQLPEVPVQRARDLAVTGKLIAIRGVVTWVEEHGFFVQDASSAIKVETKASLPSVSLGDEVRVEGIPTGRGQGLTLRAASVTRIGTKPLPPGEETTMEALGRTGFHCQRVRITGSVHDVAIMDNTVRLLVQGRTNSLTVWWTLPATGPPPEIHFELLDAVVEVTGVAHSSTIIDGDAKGGRIMLASRDDLRILCPGSSDIFTRPLRPLSEMREPVSLRGERFRMKGTVTYASPAGWFYFQDETGHAARAGKGPAPFIPAEQRRAVQANPALHPGETVDVVGYRINGTSQFPALPWLGNCEWRVTGKTTMPTPVPLDSLQITAGDFDGKAATLGGVVVDTRGPKKDVAGFFNHYLTIDDKGVQFLVLVQKEKPGGFPVSEGDYVSIDGVVVADRSPEGRTTSFQLDVNDFTDIRRAMWPFNQQQLLRWLLGGAGVAVVAVIWIALLRIQVRLKTTQLLESSRELERFKTVTDTTTDLVAMATLEGKPVYLNPAGRELLGLSPDEDVGKLSFRDIYSTEAMDLFEREGFAAAMDQGHWHAEIDILHRSGRRIPVSFVGLIIKSPEGRPLYMGCSARDISTRLELEGQLRQSLEQERGLNELRSTFVNTISHEFRTPLGIILFTASMLRRFDNRFGPRERAQQLDSIESAVSRMNDLVEQTLSLGRADADKPVLALIDLLMLCRRTVDEVQSASSHRCRIHLAPDDELPPSWADESMLRTILVNLLGNAVKYSPADSEITLRLARSGTEAVFTVRDHGPGLPHSDLADLFRPFHRGSNTVGIPGTGLGLAIVKRCVEVLGGTVSARNAEDGGAEFVVHLPLFETPASTAPDPASLPE